MASGALLLAGIDFSFTIEGLILVLLLCVGAPAVAAIFLIRNIARYLMSVRRGEPEVPWPTIVVVVAGVIAMGAMFFWANRPEEPELVAALEDVVASSAIDESMRDPSGVFGLTRDRIDGCSFAKLDVDQVDWTTNRLATSIGPDGQVISELLEHDADMLEGMGWTVRRLVSARDYEWELQHSGPAVVAMNDDYVLSIEPWLESYSYRLSRRSCEGDLDTYVSDDQWRNVAAFPAFSGTLGEVLDEAEAHGAYLPFPADLVSSEYGPGYGTNQLCPVSHVESRPLLLRARVDAIFETAYAMQDDGWEIDAHVSDYETRFVAQRGDRVVVAYYSRGNEREPVILRGYPSACVDPTFVSAGFERSNIISQTSCSYPTQMWERASIIERADECRGLTTRAQR